MTQSQAFVLSAEKGGHTALECTEMTLPALKPEEVLVGMKSVSLNFRDLMTAGRAQKGLIPCSDGAGAVVSVGSAVSRVKPGDRVCSLFFAEHWLAGDRPQGVNPLGSDQLPGVLRNYMVLHQDAVSKFSEHLTDEEAATLPCAGLTAWSALVDKGNIKAGDWVLCEGTGGVSTFGVVFAKAFGAKAVVTSSSNAKLEQAKQLGAEICINYKELPEWGAKVRELTGGHGCDHVLEVAGEFRQAVIACAEGGNVDLIGGVGTANKGLRAEDEGARDAARSAGKLKFNQIGVGSREGFEAMCRKLTETRLRPSVGERVPFTDSVKAFQIMQDQTFFGNICINVPGDSKL